MGNTGKCWALHTSKYIFACYLHPMHVNGAHSYEKLRRLNIDAKHFTSRPKINGYILNWKILQIEGGCKNILCLTCSLRCCNKRPQLDDWQETFHIPQLSFSLFIMKTVRIVNWTFFRKWCWEKTKSGRRGSSKRIRLTKALFSCSFVQFVSDVFKGRKKLLAWSSSSSLSKRWTIVTLQNPCD